ncbi:MAG: glycosyltransferase 87 family protein [Aulosira sp. DedQUE10]|nr:glycosyltransferase 87 family protein [Aulosira sp. DedQUE10]
MLKQKYKNWISSIMIIQFVGLIFLGMLNYKNSLGSHDINIYYQYSLNLLEGKIPYRDFNVEYPPLALLSFVLPRILTLGMSNNYHVYVCIFLLINIILVSINSLVILQIIKAYHSQRKQILVLISYTLCSFILVPVILWRYDLFPTLLTVLALLCVISTRPKLAGFCLGLGIAAKLYPVVMLPIFAAYYLAHKSYQAILNLCFGTVSAIILSFLPFLIIKNSSLFSFLSYHKERGLQIESLPAGLITLAHKFGLIEIKTVGNYGSRNIVSPLDDSVLHALPWLFIIMYSIILLNSLYRFRKESYQSELVKISSLVAYTVLSLLVFIITSKVFSPQYLIWILPFAVLLKPHQILLTLYICVTTYIMMSVGNFRELDYTKILFLNARNALVLGLSIWVFIEYLPSSFNRVFKRDKF